MARTFKRPFQPSIDSYFACFSNDALHPATPTSSVASSLTPSLPSSIQSSLLNVGMRIRKSVPEGYQTRRKNLDDAARAYGGSSRFPTTSEEGMTTEPKVSPRSFTGLVPYCGMLKVGGYSPQPAPVPVEGDLPPLYFDDDDCSSPFPSSQGSNTSSIVPSMSISSHDPMYSISSLKKRRREEADDENLGLESQPVSPRTRPISHTCMPNLNQIRTIALPKSKKKPWVGAMDAKEGLRESEMVDAGDFVEATFFRPEDWESEWDESGGTIL